MRRDRMSAARRRGHDAGLVCAHHHLYSALARGMPAPPRAPQDVHRDPRAGVVAARPRARPRDDPLVGAARRARGARVGHDRDHRPSLEPERDRRQPRRDRGGVRRGRRARRVLLRGHRPQRRRRRQGRAGRERAVPPRGRARARRRARVLHALRRDARRGVRARRPTSASACTCTWPKTRSTRDAGARLADRADDDWLLAHCVHLDRTLPGTVVHNPRSNLNNAVGYGRPGALPARRARHRRHRRRHARRVPARVRARARRRPDRVARDRRGAGSRPAPTLVPEVRDDVVTWSYAPIDPWHLAYTTGVQPRAGRGRRRGRARRARSDPRRRRPRSAPAPPSRPCACSARMEEL